MKEDKNVSYFNIEIPQLVSLSVEHLKLIEPKVKKYETTFYKALNGYKNKSAFTSAYCSVLKYIILNSVRLQSEDRNNFIIILDKFLTHNAQRVYNKKEANPISLT